MDKLINAVKIILFPFMGIALTIKKMFVAFAKRWKKADNDGSAEDKIAIGFLYTLFLIVLGLVPMIFYVFIHNIILLIFCILITVVSLPYAIVGGWIWITDELLLRS